MDDSIIDQEIPKKIVCTASIYEINTWYIFRDDKTEVKVKIVEGEFRTNQKLTNLEIEFLNNNFR